MDTIPKSNNKHNYGNTKLLFGIEMFDALYLTRVWQITHLSAILNKSTAIFNETECTLNIVYTNLTRVHVL